MATAGRARYLSALLLAAGVVVAMAGGWSLKKQFGHRSPLVITCAEYARARPSVLWLRARDCDVDYLNAGYRESRGIIQELFFAVRPSGAPRSQPAPLVAATRDPAVLAIAQEGIGEGRQPTQEQFLIMMLRIVTTLNAARHLEGRVRVGWLDRLRARRVLSGLTTPVAPGALVMDLHAPPAFTGPAVQLALGSALVLAAIVLFRKAGAGRAAEPSVPELSVAEPFIPEPSIPELSIPESSIPEASVPEPSVAEPFVAKPFVPLQPEPIVSTTVQLRGLLLLNLGPSASTADIEYAPPLGNRDEVIRRISQAIDGIQFDARGRGVLHRADHAVIVDVGHEQVVSSAIAGADGATGVAALGRLLGETGWRAYVPLKGKFYQ